MSLPLVAIRPEPGLSATLAEARKSDLAVFGDPLFAIEPRAWAGPDPATIDGLLIGSGNAIRHGGGALVAFRGTPVYAVGAATARTARDAGFDVAQSGNGGLQDLLDGLAGRDLSLLRLAGEEHVPLAPPRGIELITRVAYASVPQPMPARVARTLRKGAVVLLHSAAAARHLAAECDRLGVERRAIALAALAPRIAEVAGPGWRAVRTASQANDAALLALARDMCHSAA
jgi:uroporphyrinogen-III synthase